MKTVLFFHPSADLYGADKILLYILKEFPSYRKILAVRTDGPLIEVIKSKFPDVEIHIISFMPIIARKYFTAKGILSFFYDNIKFKKIAKVLPTTDVIYLNTLAVLPIAYFYKQKTKILHVHEILDNGNILNRIINKLALKAASVVFCVSEAVKNNLSQVLNSSDTTNRKLRVVHNGIKINTAIPNTQIAITDGSIVNIALIGRIKPCTKGQSLLLEAYSMLPVELQNKSHLYFVGDTVKGQEYMLEEIKDTIRAMGLYNNVTIIPFIKEIETVYEKMDIIIVPSIMDPFPTVVLEGMACSKPVIGTKTGGIPEMLIDGKTGFLTGRKDPVDLCNKLEILLTDSSLREKMGQAGKAYFELNFTEEAFSKRFNEELGKIIGNEPD